VSDSDRPLALRVRINTSRHAKQKTILARQVLLTTNAAPLHLTGLHNQAEPKLTLALGTAPLTLAQLRATGLASRHPFYTVDFPYLWGRPLENNGCIFGAGLVPMPTSWDAMFSRDFSKRKPSTPSANSCASTSIAATPPNPSTGSNPASATCIPP
jgi:hypothetical protein